MKRPSDEEYVKIYTRDSVSAVDAFFRDRGDDVVRIGCRLAEIVRRGGKIALFGNGGSAADAQHLAAEFVGRCFTERGPVAALALTTDTSCLTAVANDYGFENVFARQVRALIAAADAVVGLSTSGASPNVLRALAEAREIGAYALGFSGGTGGGMAGVCDELLIIPSHSTQIIQQVHITLGHLLVGIIERNLAPKPDEEDARGKA